VIRVVVIAGRGHIEDLAPYDEMERLNRKASEFESGLSRSFLVEHKGSVKEILSELESKQVSLAS
jgi:phosphohistidine phosphatase SixA